MNKEIFDQALKWYLLHCENTVRKEQITTLTQLLRENFYLDKINCIETGASQNKADGAVGLYFSKLSELTKGEFISVDNSQDIVEKSKELYKEYEIKTYHHVQDSVDFLNHTKFVSNLVHLDSWDLDLKNPFPSALHGWLEFQAIKDKMPVGSIVVIDDNYYKGTWVDWVEERNLMDYGDQNVPWERLDINYPIVGKGSLIYHYIERKGTGWVKLNEDVAGANVKLVIQKIK